MGRFEVFSVWFDRNMLSRVKSPNLTVQSSFESKKVAKFKFAQDEGSHDKDGETAYKFEPNGPWIS